MISTLLGIKRNMTATYDSRGRRVGATIVEISPNYITQLNKLSVQLGYGTKKSVKKPQIGHVKKAGLDQKIRWFREVKTEDQDLKPGTEASNISLGQEIKLDQVFSIGDALKITGTSKGKGFAGVVKRHGFAGGPRTHGQSDRLRAPGAIGSGTTPGRVYKGKKMAGHMGGAQVSTRGLEVVGIDKEKNLLTVKGAVPGATGGLIMVTKLGRIKGYTPPPEEKIEETPSSETSAVGSTESASGQTQSAPVGSPSETKASEEGKENAI